MEFQPRHLLDHLRTVKQVQVHEYAVVLQRLEVHVHEETLVSVSQSVPSGVVLRGTRPS